MASIRSRRLLTLLIALLFPMVNGIKCNVASVAPPCAVWEIPELPDPLEPSTKTHVVVVLVDDQGWTGTSAVMDPAIPESVSDFYETPNLERLAAEGTRFSAAYAAAPLCSPTRASLQTGLSPAALHITDLLVNHGPNLPSRFGHPLIPPENQNSIAGATTIASAIRAFDPDYAAAHIGKWNADWNQPAKNGYSINDQSSLSGQNCGSGNPKDSLGITTRAIDFMTHKVAVGRPFYIQLSYNAPHVPVLALADTIAKYETKPPGIHHVDPGYAAMIEDLDSAFGRLLDAIDDLGIADRTYVVFTSDNGADVTSIDNTNFPLDAGKTTLREGGIRVPFVVRGPGIAADVWSSVPVLSWDLLPTVLAWVGAPVSAIPPDVEGGSIKPVLDAPGSVTEVTRSRPGLFWHFPHYYQETPQSAVRLGDYKGILYYETDTFEVYDLAVDPGETQDLSAADPVLAASLRTNLEDYLTAVGAGLPIPNPDY